MEATSRIKELNTWIAGYTNHKDLNMYSNFDYSADKVRLNSLLGNVTKVLKSHQLSLLGLQVERDSAEVFNSFNALRLGGVSSTPQYEKAIGDWNQISEQILNTCNMDYSAIQPPAVVVTPSPKASPTPVITPTPKVKPKTRPVPHNPKIKTAKISSPSKCPVSEGVIADFGDLTNFRMSLFYSGDGTKLVSNSLAWSNQALALSVNFSIASRTESGELSSILLSISGDLKNFSDLAKNWSKSNPSDTNVIVKSFSSNSEVLNKDQTKLAVFLKC